MLRRLRIENLVLIREAELVLGPGLTALTGETGAGKTILSQAIGLLLGAKGDAGIVGPDGEEAYVEAEFDLPRDFFDDDDVRGLDDVRPEGETGIVLARRVFGDGRTRAYAWGRAVAREDLAAAAERLVAMSGQFEQRRLARPSYQLDVLDGFAGPGQLEARREARRCWRVLVEARRRYEVVTRDAGAVQARLAELEGLVEDTGGLTPGLEDDLRAERERVRRLAELGEVAATAVAALTPEEGEGAATLVAGAERAITPLVHVAPELRPIADELREVEVRLREAGSDLLRFLTSLEADPERLEQVEQALDRIASTRRRYRAETYGELLALREAAREELEAAGGGHDPVGAAREELARAEQAMETLAAGLRGARAEASRRFADAVAGELRAVGVGEGEFEVELSERELGPSGRDEARFLIRSNAGLPFGPVAATASGGELSRVALAIAAVGGGETMVFDEIDAGVGGVTAHRVADVLDRLSRRAQVIVITHLPQIASRAGAHFSVTKVPGDPTHTRVRELDERERRAEIERMLGGEEFLTSVASR